MQSTSNDFGDILFRARAINILGGELSVGSAAEPYVKRATIHLYGIKNKVTGFSLHTNAIQNLTWTTKYQKKINNTGGLYLYGERRRATTARLQYSVRKVHG